MIIKSFNFKQEDDCGQDTREMFLGAYISELVTPSSNDVRFNAEFHYEDFRYEDPESGDLNEDVLDCIASDIVEATRPTTVDSSSEDDGAILRSVYLKPINVVCYANDREDETVSVKCYLREAELLLNSNMSELLVTFSFIRKDDI